MYGPCCLTGNRRAQSLEDGKNIFFGQIECEYIIIVIINGSRKIVYQITYTRMIV